MLNDWMLVAGFAVQGLVGLLMLAKVRNLRRRISSLHAFVRGDQV